MGREVRKNTLITDGVYAGERELGVDFFTGEQLADLDAEISHDFVCDRCGFPLKVKPAKTNGLYLCKKCIDDAR
jgi:formylmethanofuran dehydrogenase subunit E